MKKAPPEIFSLLKISVAIICSLAIFLGAGGSAVAQGDENRPLAGNWKTDLFFHPAETDGSIDYNSSLELGFSLGSFDIGSTSTFSNIGDSPEFTDQSFDLSGRLELFDISSRLVFDTKNIRLDYWLSETSLTFGGATFSSTFLLEYHLFEYVPGVGFEDYPAKYGAGLEFSVSGDTPRGGSAEINSLFGMERDEFEEIGVQSGSGYDIVQWGQEGKFTYGTSSLHYVSTTVNFFDLSLGCCTFNSETKFSYRSGFEYSEFDFTVDSTNLPLSFDTTIRFTPQTKSVTLDPYLEINTECFTTYFDLVEGSINTYQFEVEGFGLTDVKLGRVNFSSITALKGDLYKDAGASDILLRADDYLIDPDNTDPYEKTDFDEIASISVNPPDTAEYPNYSFGIDFYFDMSDEATLIDLSLVTGDLTARVSRQFELGMGTSITPDGDVETLLEFDAYF